MLCTKSLKEQVSRYEDMGNYGEFEEVKENAPEQAGSGEMQEGVSRARMPRRGEFIGIILQRLGGNRMEVKTTDGKSRNCRVPGKYKRSLWLRPRDIVLVTPWQDDDGKGDVIYKYNSSAIIQLRKKGLIDNLKVEF